ncbi:MAG: PAS domain-containing protein, partial [Cyanobacteria bacterium P01_F01_bin.116]
MSLSVAPDIDTQAVIGENMANSLNAVASPIYVKDRQHRWIFANKACCQLLEVCLDELVGCLDHEVVAVIDTDLLQSQ